MENRLLTEVEAAVFHLYESRRLTRSEIARQLDVSPTRVGQIYNAACTKLKDFAEHGEDALSLLPARARQVVVEHEIGSRALTRSAIESGRLSWKQGIGGIFWNGVMLRNLSEKTWLALYDWAGRPPIPKD